jgi:hypothetical protein
MLVARRVERLPDKVPDMLRKSSMSSDLARMRITLLVPGAVKLLCTSASENIYPIVTTGM